MLSPDPLCEVSCDAGCGGGCLWTSLSCNRSHYVTNGAGPACLGMGRGWMVLAAAVEKGLGHH